jgi:hypothetical protein
MPRTGIAGGGGWLVPGVPPGTGGVSAVVLACACEGVPGRGVRIATVLVCRVAGVGVIVAME